MMLPKTKREELYHQMMLIFKDFMRANPGFVMRKFLIEKYRFPEVKFLSVNQVQEVLTYMQTHAVAENLAS